MHIVSGGQTGADRAALDIAIERGMSWSGWCPKGGWAEDLPKPPNLLDQYLHLKETPLAHPLQRTQWNVRDSDAIFIITDGGGVAASIATRRAQESARSHGNPSIVVEAAGEIRHRHEARDRQTPRERGSRHLRSCPEASRHVVERLIMAGPAA
jgi:hypothetical protein